MTTRNQERRRVSNLSGEVAVLSPAEADSIDVPFYPGFDIEKLKKQDSDPMFVTVSIKPGHGDQGKGFHYGADILRSIEQQINDKRPPGFKGHQNPDTKEWEYREPVTGWLGASFVPDSEEGTLYVKGYVPTTSSDLREQLSLADAGITVVDSVSIFGMREVDGNKVTAFDLWSLDWTPKGQAGMETALVDVSGEQTKEDEVTRDEFLASLKLGDIPASLADELRKEGVTSLTPQTVAVGEMRVIFDLDEGADPEALVAAVRSMVDAGKATLLSESIDDAIDGAEITAEMAKDAVRDAVASRVTQDSTKEEIVGEMSTVMELPYIKALVSGNPVPVIQGGGTSAPETLVGSHWA
jgi:hypothetical protein